MTTISMLLKKATEHLQTTSPSPRLDAELLLGHVLQCSRLTLIRDGEKEQSTAIEECFNQLLKRRANHEPVAYITGVKEFYGLEFTVNPSVLIPRPETELLVERALQYATTLEGNVRILDLGTGSGCIPVSLAVELRKKNRPASIVAVDLSERALEVARENGLRHHVDQVIEFRQSDWFTEIRDEECFDIIVSNPPYIAPGDQAVSPELVHEPQSALYAPNEGREAVEIIIDSLLRRKNYPRVAMIEVGASQAYDFEGFVKERSRQGESALYSVLHDLAGLPRVVSLEFNN